jgi:hypothetical protein
MEKAAPAGALRRLRRQRLLAGAAVGCCIVANVWTVSLAAPQPDSEGSLATIRRVSTEVGLRSKPAARKASEPRVVERGDGKLTPVAIPDGVLESPPQGRSVRIGIETEGGLPVDATEFATAVATTLSDPRGWQAVDEVRFVAVSPAALTKGAKVDVRIALASPETTDRLCAPLRTRGQVSCHSGGRAVINLRRWQLGAEAYGTDLAGYRTYVVNHEVGHSLGHGHAFCAGKGEVAPVMMQQTYGLQGCTAWPWPSAKAAD